MSATETRYGVMRRYGDLPLRWYASLEEAAEQVAAKRAFHKLRVIARDAPDAGLRDLNREERTIMEGVLFPSLFAV